MTSRKPSPSKRPAPPSRTDHPSENVLQNLQRDLDGLIHLQQFQNTLLSELRRNINALKKKHS